MLGFYMRNSLYLFLCMVVTKCYERRRTRIRAVQVDNIRGLLVIRRMDKVLSSQIRELCRVMKGVNKRIDKSVF